MADNKGTTDRRFPAGFLPGMLIFACFFSISFTGYSDLLTLQGGETLTGTLLRIRSGTLVFRTSLEGQMMLPLDRARSLSTVNAFSLKMSDGRMLIGRFSQEEQQQLLLPPDPALPVFLVLEEIAEALPIPATTQVQPTETPGLPRLQSDSIPRLQTPGREKAPDAFGTENDNVLRLPGLTEKLRDPLPSGEGQHPFSMTEEPALPPPLLRAEKTELPPPMLYRELRPRLLADSPDTPLLPLENLFKNPDAFFSLPFSDTGSKLRIHYRPERAPSD